MQSCQFGFDITRFPVTSVNTGDDDGVGGGG